MIVGTLDAIALWAKATIEAVDGSNKVWEYRRKIRTSEQLIEDLGTGEENAAGEAITWGWLIDVASFDILPVAAIGTRRTYGAIVNYTLIASLEDRGANKSDVVQHAEAVVNALQAESKPDALTAYTTGGVEITMPVSITLITSGEFPIGSGRQHYRVDMTQQIRLTQPMRS